MNQAVDMLEPTARGLVKEVDKLNGEFTISNQKMECFI
jgi:hypothetical protein